MPLLMLFGCLVLGSCDQSPENDATFINFDTHGAYITVDEAKAISGELVCPAIEKSPKNYVHDASKVIIFPYHLSLDQGVGGLNSAVLVTDKSCELGERCSYDLYFGRRLAKSSIVIDNFCSKLKISESIRKFSMKEILFSVPIDDDDPNAIETNVIYSIDTSFKNEDGKSLELRIVEQIREIPEMFWKLMQINAQTDNGNDKILIAGNGRRDRFEEIYK